MKRVALRALLSHWRRQPLQLATLLIGLALATALWSAVQAINQQARQSYDTAAAMFGGTSVDRLALPDGAMIPVATYTALRRAGWRVSPMIEAPIRRQGRTVTVIGLDPLTAPAGTLPPEMLRALAETPAALLVGDGIAFAAPERVAASPIPDLPPLRIAANLPPDTVVMDIRLAAALVPDGLTRLLVHPVQPLHQPPLSQLAPQLDRTTPATTSDLGRLTDSFHLNLTAFGLLSFAVGLFIVHAGIGLAFEQRRPLMRTLRALGLPLRHLLTVLLAELLVLAMIAGAAGVVLGYAIAAALLPDVSATLRGLYGAPTGTDLGFDPLWAASGMAIALAGALVAAASGLWSVARMPLLASARPRAWAMGSARTMRRQAMAGMALIGLGALSVPLIGGLLSGFALLGGLLMGAALLLPLTLSLGIGLGAALARAPVARWFWADTRQQLPGLSLALMALLLALATNIGVGTMVSSFRLTFTGWLDQRLASELYVTATSEEQAAALRDWLPDHTSAVLPIWSVPVSLNGRDGEIFGIVDHATYRDHWPLLAATPTVWTDVQSGGVLINEQLSRRAALHLGDPLTLGANWQATIVGIYSDYGNPSPQAITGLHHLTDRHPDLPRLRYGLRIPPDQTDTLRSALVARFGMRPDQIVDQSAIKSFSLSVFEQTFTVTAALNILTLSVAGFAILTSLLTLAALRLPQLAPAWALGLPRRKLALLDLTRSLALALATWILAVPTGLALAWALLAIVNVEAFGWRLPMHLFPAQWGTLLAMALLSALLASLYPVWRLARTAPSAFLKVFAHDR